MKDLVKLLRVKHYIKNFLIFVPIFFSGHILDSNLLIKASYGFFAFSLISSSIYIINDIQDMEKDKLHPIKKNRPIASGMISIKKARVLAILLLIMSLFISIYSSNIYSIIFLLVYFVLNAAYSYGLKNRPLIDIAILASGFLIRLVYGAFLNDIVISSWLYMTVFSGSIYMGLGKRRNEIDKNNEKGSTRLVLKYYNYDFLDKNMSIYMSLTIAFYSLWAVLFSHHLMIWSVPLMMFIIMKYSLNIETDSDGDPVNVLLHDKILLLLVLIYSLFISYVLYFNH